MKQVSVSEAKAHFAEYVRAVESGDLVVLTRHGKPVAAIVRPENIDQLGRLRAAGPESGLASLSGGWKGVDEVIRIVAESPRATYRVVPDLD